MFYRKINYSYEFRCVWIITCYEWLGMQCTNLINDFYSCLLAYFELVTVNLRSLCREKESFINDSVETVWPHSYHCICNLHNNDSDSTLKGQLTLKLQKHTLNHNKPRFDICFKVPKQCHCLFVNAFITIHLWRCISLRYVITMHRIGGSTQEAYLGTYIDNKRVYM